MQDVLAMNRWGWGRWHAPIVISDDKLTICKLWKEQSFLNRVVLEVAGCVVQLFKIFP